MIFRSIIPLVTVLLPGCGEPEASRFTPAKGDASGVSAADRPGSGKSTDEATIPKNIPMH